MKRRSPVRVDLLFWLILGAPLLWLTYGQFLQFDESSLGLLILKQVINGVLNIALAEQAYTLVYFLTVRSTTALELKPVAVESLLLSLMAGVAIIPAVLFMRLDAPTRQMLIEERIDIRLSQQLLPFEQRAVDLPSVSNEAATHDTLVLAAPDGNSQLISKSSLPQWAQDAVRNVPTDGRTHRLMPRAVFGNSPMNIASDTLFAQAITLPGVSQGRVVGIIAAKAEVARQRVIQADILTALFAILLGMTVLAYWLAKRSKASLERIGEAVADLAALGGTDQSIRELVVEEFGEIAQRVARASSSIEREREALSVNRRRLQSIASHAPLIIYAIKVSGDEVGQVSFVSRSVESLLGYTAYETEADGWWSTSLHPDDRAMCFAVNDNFKPSQVITHEYRIRHKLGHYVWVYDCLAVDEAGDEAVGIMFDITGRKNDADKLVQANKMESLGRMAAGVAHELNQPLNFIGIAAQNLKLRLESDRLDQEKAREKLDLVLTQVQRAAAIVDQVRTFGRSDNGPATRVVIDDVVHEVIELMDIQLTVLGISLESVCEDASVAALAQPARLAQVLINLILNARDAIEMKRDASGAFAGAINIRVYQQGRLVKIAVEDNGTGISPNEMNLLFEPFFTTKSPGKGTGLGLSVSYGIIAELGGTIRAESLPFGARFVVSLPALVD